LFSQIARGGKSLATLKGSGENRFAQAEIHLPEERLASFRKWYYELHTKWFFKNTMNSGMLER
jgi:hypothetical protein